MKPKSVEARLVAIFAKDPMLAYGLFCAAGEIADDFEKWGPVIQANENGEYDDTTTIVELQGIRDEIRRRLYS